MAIFRNALNGLLGLALLFLTTASVCAQTSFILPNAYTQFIDNNGNPVVGGKVYFYVPSTTTPKTTWQDPFQATPNADPVILDSGGRALIFGNGNYREQLFDANNNLIWDGFTSINAIALGTNNTWTGDQFFVSGRPWCDVMGEGAKGDGLTDDTAAFQACLAKVTSGTGVLGGTIYVPPAPSGQYCLFSGLNINSNLAITLTGSSFDNTTLNTCGHDVPLLTLANASHSVQNIQLFGPNIAGTVHDTLVVTANGARIEHVKAFYGRHAINYSGADGRMTIVSASSSFGTANVYVTGSFSCNPCTLDQQYPVSTPAAGTNRTVWASATPYVTGNVVTSGTHVWQAANSGTSGGSAPSTQPFNTYIQDNVTGTCPSPSVGICWLYVGETGNAAAQIDTGASSVVFSNRSDFTGSFTYGVNITGNGQGVSLTNSTFSSYQTGVFDQSTVGGLIVMGSNCSGMISTTAQCFYFRSSDDQIIGSSMINMPIGIEVDTGVNYVIANNQVFGAGTAAIYVGGTVSNTTIMGNQVSSSVNWGINAIGVDIASSGTDYITVLGNECNGATTCVSNSSTGTHNVIETTPGLWNTAPSIKIGSIISPATTNGCVLFADASTAANLRCNGNLTTSSTGNITLGSIGAVLGTATFANTTGGSIAISPPTGALGTVTNTLQAANDTFVYKSTTDTLQNKTLSTATNTFTGSGASSSTFLRGDNTWASTTGGAMTFLCSIVASNSATFSYASPTTGTCTINGTYTSYVLVFQSIVPATNERILELQIHSGGAFKSSGYLTNFSTFTGSSITGGQAVTTYIPLTYPTDSNAASLQNIAPGYSAWVYMNNPSASAICVINASGGYVNGNTNAAGASATGWWNTAGVVDGFQVLMDSGNITSGTILVYGIS